MTLQRIMTFLLPLLLPAAAHAQQVDEGSSPVFRAECHRASQWLANPQRERHPHFVEALGIIASCNRSGGPALAALWVDPPREASALDPLVRASSRLHDRRVVDAVVVHVQRAGEAEATRIAALLVLARYVDPAAHVTREHFAAMESERVVAIGTTSGAVSIVGAQPPAPDTERAILALFRRLAAVDSDPRVRAAAEFLVKQLD